MSTVAHRLVLPLTAAVIVLLAGGGRPAAADPGECRHGRRLLHHGHGAARERAGAVRLAVRRVLPLGHAERDRRAARRSADHDDAHAWAAPTRLPRSASQCGAASPPRTAGTPRAWRFGG